MSEDTKAKRIKSPKQNLTQNPKDSRGFIFYTTAARVHFSKINKRIVKWVNAQSPSLSIVFIVEQRRKVVGFTTLISSAFTALTQLCGKDDEIAGIPNELPISSHSLLRVFVWEFCSAGLVAQRERLYLQQSIRDSQILRFASYLNLLNENRI